MKTGKGAGAPSRRTRRTGEKTPAKKKRVTAARMPRAPKTEAERLRDAAAALAYLKTPRSISSSRGLLALGKHRSRATPQCFSRGLGNACFSSAWIRT